MMTDKWRVYKLVVPTHSKQDVIKLKLSWISLPLSQCRIQCHIYSGVFSLTHPYPNYPTLEKCKGANTVCYRVANQ